MSEILKVCVADSSLSIYFYRRRFVMKISKLKWKLLRLQEHLGIYRLRAPTDGICIVELIETIKMKIELKSTKPTSHRRQNPIAWKKENTRSQNSKKKTSMTNAKQGLNLSLLSGKLRRTRGDKVLGLLTKDRSFCCFLSIPPN
jgi:hypothetical protein